MSEEIEELIEYLKECGKKYLCNQYYMLYKHEIKKLVSYIEKLQQENTHLKSVLKEIREYIKNTNFWGLYEDIPMSEVKYGDDILEIIDKGIGEDK